MGLSDPHHLQRFIEAQAPVYEHVLAELRAGRKYSHWIWYIFPQIAGLGRSPTAQLYAIRSLDEARAYIEHPILGPRLRECTQIVNQIEGSAIHEIFGPPDDLKFRSSMTLFSNATNNNEVFSEALRRYFDGKPDPQTLQRIEV